jgi:prolipoprotein diacylglyceryltransferase
MLAMYLRYRKVLRTGFLFGLVITLIFSARFVIEFFKEDQVPFEKNMILNMGQLLSIPLILMGIGFMVYALKRGKQVFTD